LSAAWRGDSHFITIPFIPGMVQFSMGVCS
jgi:hypothetical protein